ncbi:hypothetical protein [Streptomyces fructofermentans]|uniref:DNA-binding protein n=1 Tax=Streptomyces fructofermentans TaxID=152141 RepID=A0A918NME1_9ACTN|nr:hypothetical protein [Streptomyces fructofermentans]GGX80710.1 hypothetical protein GCM10010515_55550 [Streptomyces fructofermentans]
MTTYADPTTTALLEAGAVLPVDTATGEDADILTVRTYTHPALEDRRVVRLVPGTLGEAEDLALEFLDLVREPETPEVGRVRRETLGFPAWALVNDPANGHHALALVKDVERLARQAKSRPGTAKEGFEALGERLGRAVPHFLPTFYEQAARVFLQHENTTYAAAFFGKAREAERVHALSVDEERQRAVFLEFAFAGALTVKALKEYVKDLAQRLDPATAWAQFRQLSVERCAAGMPPYASLPQDARGLVRAAGLDRVTEECAFVADLLASPAAVRAPASFWTAYRATVPVLVERQPAVRARLLEIMPTGLGRADTDDEFWLTLLTESGADRLLTGEDDDAASDAIAADTAPADGVDRADWLSRWAAHRKHGGTVSGRSPLTLGLVERMAPRLRADGRPVDLFTGRWHAGADLDLLDLCAASGVPLAMPAADKDVHLALDRWLRDKKPGARDLTATAADPLLRPLLHRAIGALGDDRTLPGIVDDLAAHPVLGDVLREYLDDAAEALTSSTGLPAARAALGRLRPFRTVAAQVSPQAVARVAAHEIAPLLGRTLRAGIPDELGWPALDEALGLMATEKGHDRDDALQMTEAWPALILFRGNRAVVVGPDKVLLDHDLRIPVDLDRWQRPHFRYTDGELLVMWRHDNKQHGYWSARPSEVFALGGEQLPHWYGSDLGEPSIPLSGGGRATGGRALHAGDTVLPAGRPVIGDGTTCWRQGRQGRQQVWMEYDPVTGTHGRASLPAFLRSGILEDATLLQQQCEVMPLQPGLEHSPFGTDGTVLGRWVRTEGAGAETRTTTGTPDGRTVTLRAADNGMARIPLGALLLPGGAEPVAALVNRQVVLFAPGDTSAAGELGRISPGQRGGEFAAGSRFVPPLAFWHALRPRDERASALLRGLTDDRTADVLRGAAEALAEREAQIVRAGGAEKVTADPADAKGRTVVPAADHFVRRAVSATLTDLTDERLLIGVSALVHGTLRLSESITAFVRPPAPPTRPERRANEDMFSDYSPLHGEDRNLRAVTAGIADLGGWWGGSHQWSTLRQIRSVNHVLSGRPAEGKPLPEAAGTRTWGDGWRSDERTVPGMGVVWPSILGVLRPLAYRAATPAMTDAEREALLLLLEAVAEGPLAAPEGGLRQIVLTEPHENQQRAGQVIRRDGRTVVVLACQSVDSEHKRVNWLALDHDPSGGFGAVAHFTLSRERVVPRSFAAGGLAAVTGLVRDKGAAPWRAEAPAAFAAATREGLGPVQAAVLLAARPQNPVPDVLATIGLKPRQLDLGNGRLSSLDGTDRTALMSALLPEDPSELWTTGPDTVAAGRVWAERLGSVVRLPEDLAADLAGLPASSAEAVLNPVRTPWIARTTVQLPDKDGNLVAADPSALPGRHDLAGGVASLASLAYALPYGHPLRALLPEGLEALRRRLTDPGLLLDLDVMWTDKGGSTAVELRKAYGLGATGGADAHGLTPLGEALVLRPWYADQETVLIRPVAVTGTDDPVIGLLEGLVGPHRDGGIRALRSLLGGELAGAVSAGLAPEGPSGHAQDPTVSVPALVAEVASALGLGQDAAALYLQLLALPDPTDRNCARWTGWRPARMKKARAELAATDLVVEAKRPRAGRTLFLPCGWRDLKSPALPVEIWKEGLYPVSERTRAVPLLPVPDLFARAWDRVRAGDAPAYEELTTRATRKGRRR